MRTSADGMSPIAGSIEITCVPTMSMSCRWGMVTLRSARWTGREPLRFGRAGSQGEVAWNPGHGEDDQVQGVQHGRLLSHTDPSVLKYALHAMHTQGTAQ